MKIGELARRTGVSVRMLRYYEREGLLTPDRAEGGYRIFRLSDVDTVGRIRLLGNAGMILPVVRQFLPCSLSQRHTFEPCDELKSILRAQIDLLDDKTRKLSNSRALLTSLLENFEQSTRSC